MKSLAIAGMLLATPAGAMTVAECGQIAEEFAGVVPFAKDLRTADGVTGDGWCRVVSKPLAGVEWRQLERGAERVIELRRKRLDVEGLGVFDLAATIAISDDSVVIGPVTLGRADGDLATSVVRTRGQVASDLGGLRLENAQLTVAGNNKLVGDVLARAFGLDVRAARANFAVARDHRAEMLAWFESWPDDIVDPATRAAFLALVDAYPNARGVAVLTVPEDASGVVNPLAILRKLTSSSSREQWAGLVRSMRPALIWTPR